MSALVILADQLNPVDDSPVAYLEHSYSCGHLAELFAIFSSKLFSPLTHSWLVHVPPKVRGESLASLVVFIGSKILSALIEETLPLIGNKALALVAEVFKLHIH